MTAHLLSSALLEGLDACARLGVTLHVADMKDLDDVNRANAASWRPLLPIFSPRYNTFAPETTACWLGRDEDGAVVLAQAARLFDWRETTFHDEAESLRLFYQDPVYWKRERPLQSIAVTAPKAREITGLVAYTGAHWVRPDWRGKGLTGITPRMMRAEALISWDVPICCTIMAKDIFDRDVAARAGYPNYEWTVDLKNTPTGTFPAALLWATRAEVLEDLERWKNSIAN